MFLTDKAAKEKIAGLESRITELEADAVARDQALTDAQAELATANEAVVAANQERDTALARVTTLEADLVTASATIAANPTEEQIAERVETAAQAKFASLGGPPIDAGKGGEGGPQIKTRAEFNSLDHSARNAFIKGGGKLTD